MAAHEHLGAQFDRAMHIVQTAPGVIDGADARTVMNAANIRSWPVMFHPEAYSGGAGENPSRVTDDEVLHTRQSHLHGPTLRRYMAGDVPKYDPDYDYEDAPGSSDVEYRPEITMHKDRLWVQEGHHRIIASRLRGDSRISTWTSYSGGR